MRPFEQLLKDAEAELHRKAVEVLEEIKNQPIPPSRGLRDRIGLCTCE